MAVATEPSQHDEGTGPRGLGDDDIQGLATQLLDTLEDTPGDLVLDVREVDHLDAALTALSAGRSRAKYLHRHLAVVGHENGPVAVALRRVGLSYRFPVHPDLAAATDALDADRSARSGLAFAR